MAGSFVVGLGAGVILLLVLWGVVVVAWVQMGPGQTTLRTLVTLLALLFTTTLLLIPTKDKDKDPHLPSDTQLLSPTQPFQVYDYMFIWKGILMAMMGAGVVTALGVYFKEFWLAKVHGSLPVPTKNTSSPSTTSVSH